MSEPNEKKPVASQALLSAALGGLLSVACMATVACSTGSSGSGASSDTVSGADGSTGVTTNGDTPIPDTTCDGGVSPNPTITSTTVGAVTLAQFTAQCDAKHGIFETQPHCGGSNSCRGMSYDSNTQTLTQHSCRATNTCAGYSCIVCD